MTYGLRICLAGLDDELKGARDFGVERAVQFGVGEFVGRVLCADVRKPCGLRDQIGFFLVHLR
ncbi:MAG: hypothetical protein DI563_02385 [Variovorax paradoxus]|uniref:Uncharacterized protein n=1 Tax=Variovorax paradoxus TaxID=34073 RepID=A0A2W5SE00_VARPD|nr:MAG: hypothetical protein DI563_02385 [Variovorax paradoxus]